MQTYHFSTPLMQYIRDANGDLFSELWLLLEICDMVGRLDAPDPLRRCLQPSDILVTRENRLCLSRPSDEECANRQPCGEVYSLGVLLYQVLTDRSAPPLVPELAPHGDLRRIVCRATQWQPAGRYQSIAELAGDIHAYLGRQLSFAGGNAVCSSTSTRAALC